MRRWGAENYATVICGLVEDHALPTVLVGTKRDGELNAETVRLTLEKFPSGVQKPIDLAGLTDLRELTALLSMCRVHVCGDTGSAHIASALGCPVVAVYGPTDPTVAGVYGQRENILFEDKLCGANCNAKRCSRVSSDAELAPCLRAITPEAVALKLENVLQNIA